MPATLPNRRDVLATSATAALISLLPGQLAAADDNTIRTFKIEALVDLRRRLVASRWPDKETVSDQSQGVAVFSIGHL